MNNDVLSVMTIRNVSLITTTNTLFGYFHRYLLSHSNDPRASNSKGPPARTNERAPARKRTSARPPARTNERARPHEQTNERPNGNDPTNQNMIKMLFTSEQLNIQLMSITYDKTKDEIRRAKLIITLVPLYGEYQLHMRVYEVVCYFCYIIY